MSNAPKSLMRHYIEGSIVSRELEQMLHQYAADARFEAELSSYEDNKINQAYSGKTYGRVNKENPNE